MDFRVIKTIPPELTPKIESAVSDFIHGKGFTAGTDPKGFEQQTFRAIANATFLGNGGEFWVCTHEGELLTYVLASIVTDIDNRLTYWISQAWVKPAYRANPVVKDWWKQIRERARGMMCAHIVVVSSRDADAYCRFLGEGWHLYAHLLKEDL